MSSSFSSNYVVNPAKVKMSRAQVDHDFKTMAAFERKSKIESWLSVETALSVTLVAMLLGCLSMVMAAVTSLNVFLLGALLFSLLIFVAPFYIGYIEIKSKSSKAEKVYDSLKSSYEKHSYYRFTLADGYSRSQVHAFEVLASKAENKELTSVEYQQWWRAANRMSANKGADETIVVDSVEIDDSVLLSRFEKVKNTYETITSDVLNTLDYPTLFDVSVEETKVFLDQLFAMVDEPRLRVELKQVSKLERLWEDAYRYAQHVGIDYFTDKSLAVQTRKLLDVVVDTAATDGEKSNALAKAQDALNVLFPTSVAAKTVPVLVAERAHFQLESST